MKNNTIPSAQLLLTLCWNHSMVRGPCRQKPVADFLDLRLPEATNEPIEVSLFDAQIRLI